MHQRMPTLPGKVVALVVLGFIVAVVAIAVYVFLLKNPLHNRV